MGYRMPRMDVVESRAWIAMVGLCELLPAALDATLLKAVGITHFEFMLLGILKHASKNSLRMVDLAIAANASAPRISKVVRKLADRGLVERVACPGDGRAIDVYLTPAGRRTLVQAVPPHVQQVRDLVIDRTGREELLLIANLLEPLIHRLDPQERTGRIPSDAAHEDGGRAVHAGAR